MIELFVYTIASITVGVWVTDSLKGRGASEAE